MPENSASAIAEADAWMDVFLRYRFVHTAVQDAHGQWLIQLAPSSAVYLLDGPQEVLELARNLQEILAETDQDGR
ncbi:hypothetical protein ACWGCC_03965 [Streptomyces nigrescens]